MAAHEPKAVEEFFGSSLRFAIVMAFPTRQIAEMQASVLLWDNPDFFPCAGVSRRDKIDLVLYGADEATSELVSSKLVALRRQSSVSQCIGRVWTTHAGIRSDTKDSATGRSANDYFLGAPAMFFSLRHNSQLVQQSYDYIFWMEPDVVPVRHGWLDALYEETFFMRREGIWQKGSNPQYAHSVDVLAAQDPQVALYELFHINGNALFDFKSKAFGQYLTGCAGLVPGSFDFSLFKYRYQQASAPFQQVSQRGLSRFQYTELIMNNPSDLCSPSLSSFLDTHKDVVVVHGKAARAIRLGTKCCNLVLEDPDTIQNAHSDQYHCLLSNMSHAVTSMMRDPDSYHHLTLETLDLIALGLGEPSIGIDPQLVCLKDANCCFGGPRVNLNY